MTFPLGLSLRAATEDDRARVTKDWLASYRDRSKCDPCVYFTGQRAVIGRLWPLVQVLSRGDSTVCGWIAAKPHTVHYVFVPSELRRHGLGSAMVLAVAGEAGQHTHRRMPGLGGFRAWTLNPYLLGMTE